MSKKTSTPTPTELVPSGELNPRTQSAVETLGKKYGPAELVSLYAALDKSRSDFAAASLLFGIALLGVKANTPHGEFQNVLLKLWDRTSNGKRVSHLDSGDNHNACRELRSYMMLAKKFLVSLESLDGRTLWKNALKVSLPANVPASQPVTEYLLANPKSSLLKTLESFVAGRSLRQMLADFGKAAKDAEFDELADEQRGHRRQLTPEEKTAALRKEAEQLYFDELLPKMREHFLGDRPSFENLPRGDRQKLADSLHAAYQRVKKSL